MKNTFRQEKIMLQLTFNPGLTSTGFRTTRPRVLSRIYLLGEKSRVAEPPKGGPGAYIYCNDNNSFLGGGGSGSWAFWGEASTPQIP